MGVEVEQERRFFSKLLWGLRIVHCYTPPYVGMIMGLRREEDQHREPMLWKIHKMVNIDIIQMGN